MRVTSGARRLIMGTVLTVALAACGTTVPQQTVLSSGGPAAAGGGGTRSGDGVLSAADAADPADPGATAAAAGPGDPGSVAGTRPVGGVTPPGAVTAAGASPAPAIPGATPAGQTTRTTTASKTLAAKTRASAVPTARSSAGAAKASAAAGGGTTMINVGITYVDNSATTAALGGQTNNTITQKTAAQALVKGINASGGLDGRMINPSYYSFNTDDNSYDTDASSACDQFTQDNHDSVVLDTAFGTTGGFDTCLAKAGVLDIDGNEEPDAASSMASVLHANPSNMNVDRLYATVLEDLVHSGYLSRSDQIGIVVEDCADNMAAYTNTLVPLIAKLGLKAPVKADIDCTTGFASAGSAATALASDELNFQTKGVDRVMFVSLEEAVCLLLFATTSSTQGYTPGYLLSSNSYIGSELASLPANQQPQVNGAGFVPYTDVADPPAPSAVEKRCIALAQAGGVTPASVDDDDYLFFECAPLLLLESAMKSSGASTDPQTLSTAINGLGSSFASPGVLGNATTFGPTRHDGPTLAQVFGYVAGCTCVAYSGSPLPAA